MKAIQIFGHPVVMISLFLIILISGKSIGGFYMFYLLLALPHLGIHALLALLGITLIVVAYVRLKENGSMGKKILNILGIVSLIMSIVSFFYNDRGHYNYGSFNSVAFWITSALFLLSAISNIISFFLPFKQTKISRRLNLV